MINQHLENDPNSKSSKYRLPLFVGVAGVILLVLGFLGFLLPVQDWNMLLIVLGFMLLFGAAFSIKFWFVGDWIPTMFTEIERGKATDIAPPPTVERWP